MAYGVTPGAVRALNGFPDAGVLDTEIEAWIDDRTAECELILQAKGAQLPITGNDQLMRTLGLAIKYGAASMLPMAPDVPLEPDHVEAIAKLYSDEYTRLQNNLKALSAQDLLRLGVGMVASPLSSGLKPQSGFGLVGNTMVDPDKCDPWYNAYPFRFTR